MSTRKLGTYATKEEFLENEIRSLNFYIQSMIDTMKVMSMNRQDMSDELERMKQELKAAVLAEREACAKVCDHMAVRYEDMRGAALESAAESIRLRGKE
jgi:hypothetical protein